MFLSIHNKNKEYMKNTNELAEITQRITTMEVTNDDGSTNWIKTFANFANYTLSAHGVNVSVEDLAHFIEMNYNTYDTETFQELSPIIIAADYIHSIVYRIDNTIKAILATVENDEEIELEELDADDDMETFLENLLSDGCGNENASCCKNSPAKSDSGCKCG